MEVTDEMRQAVHAERCRFLGHHFDVIVDVTDNPVAINCSQCGRIWPAGRGAAVAGEPAPAPVEADPKMMIEQSLG